MSYNDLKSKVSRTELEEKLSDLKSIYLGNEEPENRNLLWIDDEEDEVDIQIPEGNANVTGESFNYNNCAATTASQCFAGCSKLSNYAEIPANYK